MNNGGQARSGRHQAVPRHDLLDARGVGLAAGIGHGGGDFLEVAPADRARLETRGLRP
jgi:hypothetical protein